MTTKLIGAVAGVLIVGGGAYSVFFLDWRSKPEAEAPPIRPVKTAKIVPIMRRIVYFSTFELGLSGKFMGTNAQLTHNRPKHPGFKDAAGLGEVGNERLCVPLAVERRDARIGNKDAVVAAFDFEIGRERHF